MKYLITILLFLPLLLNAQLPSGYGRSKIDYTQVPGTMLWLNEDSWQDASSQIPADGQKVVKVVDQSETPGNDFTQANVNYQGRIRHDALGTNRKALDLDGVEDYYESTTEYLNAPMTVFLAAYTHETTEMDNAILWCGNTDQNGFGDGPESHISLGRNGDLLSFMMGSDSLAGSGGSVYPYKYHRVEELSTVSTHAVIVSGGTNAIFTYNGGIVKIDGGVLDNADGSFFNANRTILGHPNTLARLYDGYIFELVIWNRAIPQDSVILMLQSFHEKFNQKVASPVTPPSTQEYIIRDPSQVKGLVGWWHPGTILESGGFAYRWNDASGNNYHWYQVNSSNRPQVISSYINGYSALKYDGSNDYFNQLNDNFYHIYPDITVIAVLQIDNIGGTDRRFLSSTQTAWNDNGLAIMTNDFVTSAQTFYARSAPVNPPVRYYIDDNVSATYKLSNNVAGIHVLAASVVGIPAKTSLYKLGVKGYGLSEFFVGHMIEFLIFDRELSTKEVKAIISGLQEKYGL